ncbi:F510_1955 family glycosylhydrolase [Streptomyces sp. S.PB5]|uniref:F510_1955 family glycosylhydrolase n=1 Tax=Streptomyces sp. S.PB5 TaxID=3020844 RepID=UPI0025B11A3C|nr:exo-alpha-sialidase [Streptomyces sp. S.PB5]MDN3027963.1 exo-alpha-sialidase [Streptomyces sp. S.PB5]
MNQRLTATAATAVALAFALTACSGSTDDTGTATSGVTVSHIHGLGLDPSDQRLYVATHEGVYTPDAQGRPTLVGDSKDDFMGFTVTGAKTFYASGHPTAGEGGPGNKGLIRSTDAGKSWQSLSLSGESDFHALDHVHDTVYGYDATNGLLRTSKDGSSWTDGAAIEALDITVSPQDRGLVLATTAGGVARSTDGGRTFAAAEQPVMAFLSWPTEQALYGIDTSGGLSRSTDGGSTWQELGAVPGGGPQALTAVDAKRVLAATQNGVYESKDGGRSFTKRLDVEADGGH